MYVRLLAFLTWIFLSRRLDHFLAPGNASEPEQPSVWRVVLRIVSSPPPSHAGRSAAWSARGVDQDEVPGDRIENGHGIAPPVQAYGKHRTPELAQSLLQLWLRDSYCILASPQQIEAVHPRLVCSVGVPIRDAFSGSTRAWSPKYG
jgi:hypothetical protein